MKKEILKYPKKPAKCPKCRQYVYPVLYTEEETDEYGEIGNIVRIEGKNYVYRGKVDPANKVDWECCMCEQQFIQGPFDEE